jgi:tetratricopeptide (TPR) repeat protein
VQGDGLPEEDRKTEWYDKASQHTDDGHYAQALVCIEHHLRLHPDDSRGRILYAEILADLRRFADAERVLSGLDLPETHRSYWMICAAWLRYFRRKGDDESAAAWARRLADQRPDWTPGHCYLGSSLARLGRFDEAIAAYEQAAKLPVNDENSPDEAYLNIALIRRAQGRFDDALVMLDRAVEIDPDYTVAKRVRDDILAAVQLQAEITKSTTEPANPI